MQYSTGWRHFVHLGVMGDRMLAIRLGGDDRQGAAFIQLMAYGVVVEGFVGN